MTESCEKSLIDYFAGRIKQLQGARYIVLRHIGFDPARWSRIAAGKTRMSVDTAAFMVAAFAVSREEYLRVIGLPEGEPFQDLPLTEVGPFIRRAREQKGVGLRELGGQVGISHASVRALENSDRRWAKTPIATIILIDRALGLTVSWQLCRHRQEAQR